MSKIIASFFVIIFIIFTITETFAWEKLKIISRSEWWANEQYRYWNSTAWKNIFKQNAINSAASSKRWAGYPQWKKDSLTAKSRIRKLKTAKMNAYLSKNFYNDIKIVSSNRYEWKTKLAWSISKTNSVKNIVIHHTYSEYKDSYSWLRSFYKYHAINRQWWDVWYHYIIWYDGEIFEGRAWGDYVIASHDTWNNRSTVWISLMGNYEKRKLTDTQYKSLKKLISHLTKKYWIDLNKKIPYHKECFGSNCKQPLTTSYYYPIVWHRDWKATSCPGKNIYHTIIPKLIKELQPETYGYKTITLASITAQKKAYTTKINAFDWTKIKQRISKLPPQTQLKLKSKLNYLLSYELPWKKEIIYKRLLKEIK